MKRNFFTCTYISFFEVGTIHAFIYGLLDGIQNKVKYEKKRMQKFKNSKVLLFKMLKLFSSRSFVEFV